MGRMNTREAAERLGFRDKSGEPAADSVCKLVALGYLKPVTSDGTRGPGKRMYFDSGEIEAFARGGAPAAAAYRRGARSRPRASPAAAAGGACPPERKKDPARVSGAGAWSHRKEQAVETSAILTEKSRAEKPRRVYRGERTEAGAAVYYADGGPESPLPLAPSLSLRNHSPTGFEWGYMGSGPSQLALALLLDVTGDPELARDRYMAFKCRFVARWVAPAWTLTGRVILAWLAGRLPPPRPGGDDDDSPTP
jgi:hypothetical protein